jgi:hypothetical protein
MEKAGKCERLEYNDEEESKDIKSESYLESESVSESK